MKRKLDLIIRINFLVRARNKTFWIVLIPAVLFLVKSICELFGIYFDFTGKEAQIIAVVEALFAVLNILGVVNDPTTKGISDSENAMFYTKPE